MKIRTKAAGLTAAAALALSATPALGGGHDPNLDHVINIPNFFLNSTEQISFQFDLSGINPAMIHGFSFEGFWMGTGGAWASDTIMTINDGSGNSFFLGGFPDPGPPNQWDFQGGQSLPDGTYRHGIGGDAWTLGDGNPDTNIQGFNTVNDWTFTFEQTWGTADWSNVSVTIHQVPAPGALALLGLAGLVARRRRRA